MNSSFQGAVLFMYAVMMFLITSCERKTVHHDAEKSISILLPDANGKEYQILGRASEVKATVVVFLMTDCPIANAMLPDLNDMVARYGAQGISFYGIFADEQPDKILDHIKHYQITFPCLLDDECLVAKLCGATRVPEAAIFDSDGMPIYCGRIDDRAVKIGRMKPYPAERNLADALEALLKNRKLPSAKQVTAGCYLPLD